MNKTPELFVAFIMEKSDYNFYVYLVNNSSVNFASVRIFTGGYASDDDNLIETSKIVRDKGELKSKSILQIDKSDWGELDFVIWYHLDLIDDKGNLYKYSFELPKYGRGYEKKAEIISLLYKTGMIIELDSRNGETIEEEIKTIDMKGKYHVHSQ